MFCGIHPVLNWIATFQFANGYIINISLFISLYFECYICCVIEINIIHFITSLFLYAYIKFQCKMELSKKWKRSMNWTHIKKGVLQCTVSQLAIPCEQPENPVDTNTSSYPLSQGSDPKYLHIKQNVIPHKCTSRSCQMLNKTSNQSCQVSSQMVLQSVQIAILKKYMGTYTCIYMTRNIGKISSIS